MTNRHRMWAGSAAAAALCVAMCGGHVQSPAAPLDVPGRSDSTPWIAATGSFVAVAWGASADGRTDVFLAVSRDGGATFGSPVQVNTVPGEARLGGELPPRVALNPDRGSSTPEVAVVWTARGEATAIKAATSRDGGATFTAPVTLQTPGAAGDRGGRRLRSIRRPRCMRSGWITGAWRSTAAQPPTRPTRTTASPWHRSRVCTMRPLATARSSERSLASGVCYCCKTALAAGPDGTLFAAWRHVYPGDFRDIAFAMSRDGGRSFSAPARVSEDRLGDQRMSRRRAGDCRGCDRSRASRLADRPGRRHARGRPVLCVHARRRDVHPARPDPDARRTQPAHPQLVIDDRNRIFVAWDEVVAGRRVAAVRELELQAGRPRHSGQSSGCRSRARRTRRSRQHPAGSWRSGPPAAIRPG